MTIRPMRDDDVDAVAAVFTASVHGLTRLHYTQAQRSAWAPQPPDPAAWRTRLRGVTTLVAEHGATLCGFIAFDSAGHIDLLFTSPHASRRGIASALYREAEHRLAAMGVTELFTEASLAAVPFFARQGFHVVKEETVARHGTDLRRCIMRKHVPAT